MKDLGFAVELSENRNAYLTRPAAIGKSVLCFPDESRNSVLCAQHEVQSIGINNDAAYLYATDFGLRHTNMVPKALQKFNMMKINF